MKKIFRKIVVLFFASSALLLSGCAEMFDCIAKAEPNLHSKNLAPGRVGIAYTDFIDADVTNDPNDDEYDYFFSVEGNLPAGITYHEERRRIVFTGNPTQAGRFIFKVRLTIDPDEDYSDDPFDDGNRICFGDDTITKEFTMLIQ